MRYKRRSDKNKALANAKHNILTEMGISDIQLFRINLIVFSWSSILLKLFKMRIVRIESFFARYVKDLVITKYLAHWRSIFAVLVLILKDIS